MYSTTIDVDGEKSKRSYCRMIFFGLVLVMPTFLSGLNQSFPAVAIPQMKLDINDASWFASVAIYAAPVSIVVVGFLIDKFGRKPTLLYCIVPSICGWSLLYCNGGVPLLLLGQMLNGLSIGAGFYPVQVYVGECIMVDDVRLRNVFMTWISLSVSLGYTLMLVMGNFFDYERICALGVTLCAVMAVLFYAVVPESPVWLRRQGRVGDAEWSQRRLGVERPLLEAGRRRRSTQPPAIRPVSETSLRRRLLQLRRPDVYKPTAILSAAAVLLSLCGTSTAIAYVVNIIDNSVPGAQPYVADASPAATSAGDRLVPLDSYRYSLLTGVSMCAGSLVSVYALPRLGLKRMLIASKFCIAASLLAIAYGTVVRPAENVSARVLGVTVMLFLTGLEIGPRMSFAGDVFPVDAKGYASVPALAGSLSIATANKAFPYLRVAFGGYAYCFFVVACLVGVVYVHFLVPEVVGRTLEDIGKEYAAVADD